ncbi:hypothetical protein E2C01_021564 [Portunus trituberculatus]|uniref:Uncharacterized protein n=1 Tax=Portunus trituberculatus TaxID=210409 RepID=A0A5B7E2X9_PORTR|nr:hypothetical protein [Portunus trituberculatus]
MVAVLLTLCTTTLICLTFAYSTHPPPPPLPRCLLSPRVALSLSSESDEVHTNRILARLGPQFNLGQDLVGERVGHDKGWVAHGTTQVHQSTLCQQDDMVARLEEVAVHLWLDVYFLHTVFIQPLNINLNVKVANVADDGVISHGTEVLASDDITATSGSDKD